MMMIKVLMVLISTYTLAQESAKFYPMDDITELDGFALNQSVPIPGAKGEVGFIHPPDEWYTVRTKCRFPEEGKALKKAQLTVTGFSVALEQNGTAVYFVEGLLSGISDKSIELVICKNSQKVRFQLEKLHQATKAPSWFSL